jgi:uncharacterized protein YuzE
MKQRYLEITFRNGRPVAAYIYLPRRQGDRSARTEAIDGNLIIDYAADGRAIGIEILSPAATSVAMLNDALGRVNESPLSSEEARPLAA